MGVLPENWQRAGFGIYVHWPFCAAKCPYCDFNSHVVSSIDQVAWRDAYVQVVERYANELPGRVVSSVFFGGGTPSLMEPFVVHDILDAIGQSWSLANDCEITLEANPTSVEAQNFAAYRNSGVNRVSVGVQALNDADLKALGRLHTVDEAMQAIQTARETFQRVSFDLIYARQHQSLDDWIKELGSALEMDPDHLSLYQLTIEDGTAFGDRDRRGLLRGIPNEDLAVDLYEVTQQLCNNNGLPAYEVSNHAHAGNESVHNCIYWNGGDYIGIGPGAHGRLSFGPLRYATQTALQPMVWLGQTKSGVLESERTKLSDRDVSLERLVMGLRLRSGVELDQGIRAVLREDKVKELCDLNLVSMTRQKLQVTDKGRQVLNGILRDIT